MQCVKLQLPQIQKCLRIRGLWENSSSCGLSITSTGTDIFFILLPPRTDASLADHALLEAESRVEGIQRDASNDNHNPFKADKQPLMANEIARPTFPKLNDSVHGSPEDADGRERQSCQESLELPVLA